MLQPLWFKYSFPPPQPCCTFLPLATTGSRSGSPPGARSIVVALGFGITCTPRSYAAALAIASFSTSSSATRSPLPPPLCPLYPLVCFCCLNTCEVTEKAMHAALIPDCGEFYRRERLDEILSLLRMALGTLPLPPPLPPMPVSSHKLRACCRGSSYAGFERDDHHRRSLATRGKRAPCDKCGKMVSIRDDKKKAHQEGGGCRRG